MTGWEVLAAVANEEPHGKFGRDAHFIAAALIELVRTAEGNAEQLRAEVERLRGALDRVVQLWKAQTLTLIHGEYRAALDDHVKVIEAVLRGDQ
ncbi:hypothetical protein DS6A_45 [Mycobacterium phage DS6A]|uniref:Uncharacterized protein n=1 Tax=Mycobacterium phage DS6A TaxID=45764 RepID=G8I4F5_9CAUD|nr:hypothetical protein DS6A_45 [Mycobacterium phage DS6A]AER47599.1 hypothetical protein DS6A_45 [Mycobacterium phage DS6A]